MDSEQPPASQTDRLSQWPQTEGRYSVGNRDSSVAVCTMASVDIKLPMDNIAIAGKCVTENLGIEKIVKNVVANPSIRYIIVAGKESMGHFVDNALESLVREGVDPEKRIIGAKGGIPVLKNLATEEIERFRKQVEVVNMAGVTDPDEIMGKVNELSQGASRPFEGEAVAASGPESVQAPTHQVSDWQQDPRGYFTISVSQERGEIVAEHHDTSGRTLKAISGKNAEDIYHFIVSSGLVSRQDHAAYLGRELGKAETALLSNAQYEQDTGLIIQSSQPQVQWQSPQEGMIDRDGKEITRLPTHGKLISVRKLERTKETMLTYLVNDREFPIRGGRTQEEDKFKDFLREHGMCRVF